MTFHSSGVNQLIEKGASKIDCATQEQTSASGLQTSVNCSDESSMESRNPQHPSRGVDRWKKAAAKVVSVTRAFAPTTSADEEKVLGGARHLLAVDEEASLRDLFDAFDQTKLQCISVENLRVIFQTFLNRQLAQNEFVSLLGGIEVELNQTVTYESYKATMASAIDAFSKNKSEDPDRLWASIGSAIMRMVENRNIGLRSPGGGEFMRGTGLNEFSVYSLFTLDESDVKKKEQHAAMVDHFKMRRRSSIPTRQSSRSKRADVIGEDAEEVDGGDNADGAVVDSNLDMALGWSGPWRPDCWLKKSFDFLIMAIVLFQALYIPYVASFQPPLSMVWVAADLAFDSIFLLDVCITFNIMIKLTPTQPWVNNRWIIARKYIKGWFMIDIVASIPFDLIIVGMFGSEEDASSTSGTAVLGLFKAMRLPRMLRLLKILRVLRFSKFMQLHPELLWWLQYSKHANYFRVIKMVLIISVVLHYLACMLYVVSSNENWMGMEFCDWQWVRRDYINAACSDSSHLSRYIAAYYYAMVLNQGEDIGAATPNEKIYATFSVLGGSILLAIVFGHIGILISNLSASSTAYHGKMEKLFNIMQHLELPSPLRMRIVSYYELIWSRYRSLNGQIRMFVPELNSSLRAEVYVYLRTNLILSVPFLRNCSPDVVKELVMRLKEQVYLQGDYIVHKGNIASEMYCVSHGLCEITTYVHEGDENPESTSYETKRPEKGHENRHPVATVHQNKNARRGGLVRTKSSLSDVLAERKEKQTREVEQVLKVIFEGDYFADIALVMECMSKCNMRSATFVEFCVLSREDFIDVLSQEAYTEDRKLIEEIILSKYQDDHHSDWALHTPLMRQKANVFEQPLNPLSQMQNQVKRIEQLTQALLVKLDDSTEEAKKGVSPTSHSFLTGQMSTSGSSSGRINSCSSSSSNGSGSNSNSSCSSSSLLLPRLSENTPTKNSINGGLVARATGRSQMSRYIEPISGDQNTSDEDDDEGGSS
jgi:CRP-like cAMP-binding protein